MSSGRKLARRDSSFRVLVFYPFLAFMEVVMHRIGEPSNSDAKSFPEISRRVLLEGSITASFIGISSSWSRDANAVGPEPASAGPTRQTAAYSVRQAAAQAYLHEPQPAHHSNG